MSWSTPRPRAGCPIKVDEETVSQALDQRPLALNGDFLEQRNQLPTDAARLGIAAFFKETRALAHVDKQDGKFSGF